MKLSFLLLLAILSGALAGCGDSYVVRKTHTFSNEQWTYDDSLRYEFEIMDTLALYDLIMNVKHSTSYSFQNLYTRIHTQFPDGTRLNKPVSLELADKTGTWQGDCNSKYCTVEIPIQQTAYFNQPGKYAIVIEQFMRDSIINGVKDITFEITKTSGKR